jgi:hypothetical protein
MTYPCLCSKQGGRTVYSIRIPLIDLDTILPVPRSEAPDPDNRKVDPRHAKEFGDYLTAKPEWVAPTLLVRADGGVTFTPAEGSDGQVGYLDVPWTQGSTHNLLTIDGQHRILGVHMEISRISAERDAVNRDLAKTQAQERRAKLLARREVLDARLNRLNTEFVGLDIYIEPDNFKARQMFVDVADNAKGISSAVRARFDASKIANRTLDRIIPHALLKGRVDLDQDRMTLKNPNLMGAKHVADLTRAVFVGVGGRIGKKMEAELDDHVVVEDTLSFLDSITEAFADLTAVAEGRLAPIDLRKRSLLGSVGMLRILAGVFRELRENHDANDEEVTEFFRRLNPHMIAPITDESLWRNSDATTDFEVNASAPIMRQQNVAHLVKVISGWYLKAPSACRRLLRKPRSPTWENGAS